MTSSALSLLRSGAWLDGQTFDPIRWAVPGLIPEGFGLLTGPPKAGKSWAALGIALSVASGGHALGTIYAGRPRPVLLLALEDGDRRIQRRCRHLLGQSPIPESLEYLTEATPAQVFEVIEEWLDIKGHLSPLVVLDTLGRVMPTALPGEGAYQRDYRVGARLKALAGRHPGTCLLVVHHIRKGALGDGADWMDSTSGTNGLNGSADFTVNLARPRNQDRGVLRVTGRDVPEGEFAVTCREGQWSLVGSTLDEAARAAAEDRETTGLGDRSTEILRFVTEAGAPVSPAQVADALGIPDARRYLARLADGGRLSKVARGLYTPVPTVPMSQWPTPLDTHGVSHREGGWDNGTVGTGVLRPLPTLGDEPAESAS